MRSFEGASGGKAMQDGRVEDLEAPCAQAMKDAMLDEARDGPREGLRG